VTDIKAHAAGVRLVDHEARRIAERAELKADSVGKRLDRIDDDIKDGFRKVSDSINRVHSRIDKLLWGVLAALAVVISQIVLRKVGLL
jgi:hypothetical protein